MKVISIIILFILFSIIPFGQISLIGVGNYSEDFNTLASSGTSSTVPTGWTFAESSTNANTTYTAGTGSGNTGDTYSYGATSSSERAFGELTSSTLNSTIGCQFNNQTGFTITQLPISYTGEQWRLGALGREDRLDFQYSLDATSLSTGTWIDVNNLDFIAPVTSGTIGLLDGNATANRANVSFIIMDLNITDGSTFWIRWKAFDATGTDDGLAIDDFSIDETSLPVELSFFSAIILDNAVKLNWRTETEVSNYGFEIERASFSTSPLRGWEMIGFVQGHGNSNSPKDYSFIDDLTLTPARTNTLSYRLKQIDTDGKFEYSKVIRVDLGKPAKFELSQNYPNPFNPVTTIRFALSKSENIKLTVYNLVGEQVAVLVDEFREKGIHTINFNAESLPSGLYIYKIQANGFVQSRKMTLIK